jgi:hypothetical protein
MPNDLSPPIVTICGSPGNDRDCCDLRVTDIRVIDEVVTLRAEVDQIGFIVTKAGNEGADSIVWTLKRPDGEVLTDLHMQQLTQAVEHAGLQLAQ